MLKRIVDANRKDWIWFIISILIYFFVANFFVIGKGYL